MSAIGLGLAGDELTRIVMQQVLIGGGLVEVWIACGTWWGREHEFVLVQDRHLGFEIAMVQFVEVLVKRHCKGRLDLFTKVGDDRAVGLCKGDVELKEAFLVVVLVTCTWRTKEIGDKTRGVGRIECGDWSGRRGEIDDVVFGGRSTSRPAPGSRCGLFCSFNRVLFISESRVLGDGFVEFDTVCSNVLFSELVTRAGTFAGLDGFQLVR